MVICHHIIWWLAWWFERLLIPSSFMAQGTPIRCFKATSNTSSTVFLLMIVSSKVKVKNILPTTVRTSKYFSWKSTSWDESYMASSWRGPKFRGKSRLPRLAISKLGFILSLHSILKKLEANQSSKTPYLLKSSESKGGLDTESLAAAALQKSFIR